MTTQRVAVVIGCGYLGRRLAHKLLSRYDAVWITNRTQAKVIDPVLAERCHFIAHDFETIAPPIPSSLGSDTSVDLFCLLTPSALAMEASRDNLLQWVQGLPISRAILTSSTAVYGAGHGEVVSAESVARPDSERAALLATIEQTWSQSPQHYVARLAGLYGPGRVIGMHSLKAGEAIPGRPDEFLNLLHVDDAVEFLCQFISAPDCARIELGSDGHPILRGTYYEHLAKCLEVAVPQFGGSMRRPSGNRRCDPGSTMARLNWRPTYASYREGLAAAIGITAAE
jgi:nucleoside-diphosphate-sugar epimerase